MRKKLGLVLRIAFLFAAILCVPSFAQVNAEQKSYEILLNRMCRVKMRTA